MLETLGEIGLLGFKLQGLGLWVSGSGSGVRVQLGFKTVAFLGPPATSSLMTTLGDAELSGGSQTSRALTRWRSQGLGV